MQTPFQMIHPRPLIPMEMELEITLMPTSMEMVFLMMMIHSQIKASTPSILMVTGCQMLGKFALI